jgi:hypothetical protein
MPKKLTQAEFVAKAVAVHGVGRYDYSQVVYSSNAGKVNIRCPKHGAFKQMAFAHWGGQGCPSCARERKPGPPTKPMGEKIKLLEAAHGGKYDYSLLRGDFKANDTISVVCPEHGVFTPKYSNHLNGTGCPVCAGQGLSREQWIERFRGVHGTKFDYSLLPDEITARGTVAIICPAHGQFSQKVHSHHCGNGCLKCRYENKQLGAGGWGKTRWLRVAEGRACTLYCVRLFNSKESFFKVGITSQSTDKRFKGRLDNLYSLSKVFAYKSADPEEIWNLEQLIKRNFKALRYIPLEQFNGCRECYREVDLIISSVPVLRQFLSN